MLMQVVEHSLGMPSLMLGESMEQISSNMDTRTMRQPLGVVAGIAPFNFPAMYVYIYRIYGMRLVVAVHVYAARQCLFRTDERQALQEAARRTCAHRDLALLLLILEHLLDSVRPQWQDTVVDDPNSRLNWQCHYPEALRESSKRLAPNSGACDAGWTTSRCNIAKHVSS